MKTFPLAFAAFLTLLVLIAVMLVGHVAPVTAFLAALVVLALPHLTLPAGFLHRQHAVTPARAFLVLPLLLVLAACNPNTNTATFTAPVAAASVGEVLADTQLFCQVGPGNTQAMALSSPSGVTRVIAKGASSSYVKAVCAAAKGVTVSPPPDATSAPTLLIPSFKVPLSA